MTVGLIRVMCVWGGGGGGGVAGNEGVGFLIMVEVVVFGHKAREKKFYMSFILVYIAL